MWLQLELHVWLHLDLKISLMTFFMARSFYILNDRGTPLGISGWEWINTGNKS